MGGGAGTVGVRKAPSSNAAGAALHPLMPIEARAAAKGVLGSPARHRPRGVPLGRQAKATGSKGERLPEDHDSVSRSGYEQTFDPVVAGAGRGPRAASLRLVGRAVDARLAEAVQGDLTSLLGSPSVHSFRWLRTAEQ